MAKKKTKKQSAKATLAEVIKEICEVESRYVCKRIEFLFFQNEVLVVENDVEE